MLCNGAFLEGNPVTSDYKVSNSECFMHKRLSPHLNLFYTCFFSFASVSANTFFFKYVGPTIK